MDRTSLKDFFRNKWVHLVLAVDAVVVIALIIFGIVHATRTAMLSLNVTPLDAKISVNGDDSYTNGTYQLHPGNYHIEFSHDDLDTQTYDVNLEANHTTNITAYLTKENDIDFYLQKSNLQSFNKLTDILSLENDDSEETKTIKDASDAAQYDYSRLTALPITKTEYQETPNGRKLLYDITIRENHGADCSTWLCLEVLMLGTDDKSIVEQLLTDNGFDVEGYEIKYKTY